MHRYACALALAAAIAVPAQAQTIKDAFESAWRRSAAGMAEGARAEEAQARADAARSWIRESPALSVGYQTDRVDRDRGARELEVELGLPLALPAERRANFALGQAEAAELEARRAASRLALAGEVREAYWAVQLARVESELAGRRADEARRLAADLARRLQAGEAPRVDANQAQAAQLAAEAAARAAQLDEQRARRAFAQLTGLPAAGEVPEAPAAAPDSPDAHPLLAQARAAAELARARADRAAQVRRDTPELLFALTRERGDFTESYGNTVRVGVRVPLGSAARNRVAIAQTGAERVEAEAALQLERGRVESAAALARDELAAARAAGTLADERARLVRDSRQLIARAHALGERDLAQRLRADTESHEAELAAARAQAELGRAVSRLNQTLGLLP